MENFKWTTAKGAVIDLNAEHITETTSTDDWENESKRSVNLVILDNVTIDGIKVMTTGATRKTINGERLLGLGRQIFRGQKLDLHIHLPKEIEIAIWGEYDKIEEEKRSRREEQDNARRAELKAKVANGYCLKCQSYCWGDCKS